MRTLTLLLFSTLFLASCSSEVETETESGLEGMFEGNVEEETPVDEKTPNPEEIPYSTGPTEIPDDLIPNE